VPRKLVERPLLVPLADLTVHPRLPTHTRGLASAHDHDGTEVESLSPPGESKSVNEAVNGLAVALRTETCIMSEG